MTDTPQDENWWLATDGKWYPPSSHPSAWEKDGRTPPPGIPSAPNDQVPEEPLRVSSQSSAVGQSPPPSILSGGSRAAIGEEAPKRDGSRWNRRGSCSILTTLVVSIGLLGLAVTLSGVVAGFLAVVHSDQLVRALAEGSESALRVAASRFDSSEVLLQQLESLGSFIWFAFSLLFIAWLYNAYKSVERSAASGRTWSKGWALGGFFIPLANLVIPFLVASEVLNVSSVSRSTQLPTSWKSAPDVKILVWWAGFLGWIAFRFLASAQKQQAVEAAVDSSTDVLALARSYFIFTTGALACSALAFGALVLVLSEVRANLRSADLD